MEEDIWLSDLEVLRLELELMELDAADLQSVVREQNESLKAAYIEIDQLRRELAKFKGTN